MKRIAFVALGDHALQSHLKHFIGMEGIEIVGGFDPSDKSFVRAKDEYGLDLKRYASYDEMLADGNVDGVVIGSPDRAHLEQLEAAVLAGKHVFCEKPLCNSEEELPRLQASFELAREKGLIVTSCHPRRFDPPYVWLKENIDSLTERFGKALELKMDFTYHKSSEDKAHLHNGSMLKDHFNHEIDYLHYVFGECDFDARKLHDEHDRYYAVGARTDGLMFSFGGTRRLDTKTYAETIDVRFERGSVHIDTYDPRRSSIYDHHKAKDDFESIEGIGITDYETRFRQINENWRDAMNDLVPNYLTEQEMMVNTYMSVVLPKQNKASYCFN